MPRSTVSKTAFPYARVHCVGIGGVGVSALARLLVEQGVSVTGSDLVTQPVTKWLVAHGVRINVGEHKAANVPTGTDLVVHTNDVGADNSEVKQATARKITVMAYPEALKLALGKRKIIGVAGTHGKTTTTAMIGSVLQAAKWDPTIAVGGVFGPLGGNARLGQGEWAVVEADEYRRAFLHYPSQVAVVTNIDVDHLNYFKSRDDYAAAFREFIGLVPRNGVVVGNADDAGVVALSGAHESGSLWYGVGQKSDLRATNVKLTGPRTTFEVTYHGRSVGKFALRVPGEHNVKNALAAIGVALHIGVPVAAIQKALEAFPGVGRRFEIVADGRVTVIDDYGHHPTEVEATLRAACDRFGKRRLVAVFQPHFYGRLRDFFADFARVLTLADVVVIPPVHFVAGREHGVEQLMQKFNSATLAQAVTKKGTQATATKSLDDAFDVVKKRTKPGDVIITIGAGKVTTLAPRFAKALA